MSQDTVGCLLRAGGGSTAGRTGRRYSAARGLALFLGVFTLTNLAGNLRADGFDLNLWWIDLRLLPGWLQVGLLSVTGVLMLAFAFQPSGGAARRTATAVCLGALLLAALGNCVVFYWLVLDGAIIPAVPIPLSLWIAASLGAMLWVLRQVRVAPAGRGGLVVLAIACAAGVLFPLAQMVAFGKTDYRRPADVAVVLGARVYADGRLSDALQDRVDTACELYRKGLVRKLVMSGGPGQGAVHETEAMARAAVQSGVDPADILRDEAGLNTQRTAENTLSMFHRLQADRVLVVSHGYHLPRVKMAYQRQGQEVYTVPAREKYFLRQMPYNMAREVIALWVYYLRPVLG